MQPLKSLTFVRIGSANSHKYTVNKKQLRAFRTVCNKINTSWKEFGIEYDVISWNDDVYDEHWSYAEGVQYYKDNIAPQHLVQYKDKQETLIDDWKEANKDLYDTFYKAKTYIGFSKDSYHSPPQTRGLYAFPQYRLETFLTHWDSNKVTIKHCNVGKENESYRTRVKKYVTIKYNKPTLWCHLIDEAKELKVDIKVNKYWVLINSCDYLKVLALWERRRVKQHRNEISNKFGFIKHCYQYGSKDDLEVFLVGV
jgi:uncharacterized protein YbaA (DUF1428 family)